MTDLNELWEKGRPVMPGATAPTGPRVQPQQAQPSNAPTTGSSDDLWNSARPVNPDFGTTKNPVPADNATSVPSHDPTWGEAAKAMIPFSDRWIKSAVKTGQEIVEGVSGAAHKIVSEPVATAKAVGSAILDRAGDAVEAMSSPTKAVASIAGPWLEPDTKKALSRGVAGYVRDQFGIGSGDDGVVKDDPMAKMVFDRYGDPDKIRKTMYEDPFGVTLDLGGILAGGETLAARTGLTNTARVLGGLSMVDPTNAAAKVLGPVISKGAPHVQGRKSGLGPEVTTDIRDLHDVNSDAGRRYGTEGRQEFQDAFSGNVTARQVVDRAEEGFANMKRDAGAAYRLSKDEWIRHGGTFDFSAINRAERELIDSLHSSGGIDALEPRERRRFRNLQAEIDRVRQMGNWSIDDMDTLARRMQNFSTGFADHPQMQRVATTMKNAVRQSIYDSAPPGRYREGLANYHEAMNDMDELRSSLGLGKDASEHTVMSKLQSILRNNAATQYGARMRIFDTLEREGGVNLKPWLLGMAANSDAPRGITGAMQAAKTPGVIGGGIGAGIGSFFGSPLLGGAAGAAIGAGTDAVLSSPRLAARTARHIGGYGDAWSDVFPLLKYGALQGDREKNARGGRIGYAEGGEVESLAGVDPLVEIPMPALRGAVNAALPKAVDPMAALLGKSRIGPSQLLLPPRGEHDPQVRQPAMPAAESGGMDTDKMVKQLGAIYGEVSGEAQEKRDKEKAEKEAALRGPVAPAPAATGDVKASYQGAGGAGAVVYDPNLALPEAKPIPGDSYEAKVGSFESSGSDTAVNKTTGAAGVFQFMPSTAEGIRRARPDLGITDNWRTNREDQMKLMKAYTDDSRAALAKMGQEATGGRLYMMHLFGQGGGQRVLSQLDKSIKDITTEAERAANPFLNQFATGKDLLNYFERRFG